MWEPNSRPRFKYKRLPRSLSPPKRARTLLIAASRRQVQKLSRINLPHIAPLRIRARNTSPQPPIAITRGSNLPKRIACPHRNGIVCHSG